MNTQFSYHSLRGSGSRKGRRLIVATIIVILVLAIDGLSGGGIRTLVRAASARVWGAGSQAFSAISGSGFLSTRRALLGENEGLKQEVARLQAHAAALEVLQSENASLRRIVRLAEAGPGITTPIISSSRSSPYGTFMVGAGSKEGVVVGDLVVMGEGGSGGFVVGRVSEVSKHLSLATQIFAPNASTEATIRGASVILEGQGGGNARAEVPRAFSVSPGDVVLSARFRGRAIGVVGSVSDDPSSAYKNVYIGLPVGLDALQFVYVVSADR